MNKKTLWDPYAEFEKIVLSNGLSVYYAYWNRPWIRFGFVVHSGSFADPEGKEGLAHFVEHMLIQNIAGISNKEAELFFQKMGGRAKFGETSSLATQYSFFIPYDPKLVNRALDIFGSMLMDSPFEKYFGRERKVILNEYGNRYPVSIIYDTFEMRKRRMLYEGLFMEKYKGNLGDEASITSISQDDLRQFYVENYVPKNMSVVVVGNLSKQQCLDCMEKSRFAKHKQGIRRQLPKIYDAIAMPKETRCDIRMSEIGGLSLNVASFESYVAFPGNRNTDAIMLFRHLFNEVLDDVIRQRYGAAYSFGVSFTEFVMLTELSIGGRVDPAIVDNLEGIIEKELESLHKKKRLFSGIKESKINDFKLIDINGGNLLKNSMYDLKQCQRIVSLQEEIESFSKVSFSEVCSIAEYIAQRDRRWTLIVRP